VQAQDREFLFAGVFAALLSVSSALVKVFDSQQSGLNQWIAPFGSGCPRSSKGSGNVGPFHDDLRADDLLPLQHPGFLTEKPEKSLGLPGYVFVFFELF
jgi:hypothetical protein